MQVIRRVFHIRIVDNEWTTSTHYAATGYENDDRKTGHRMDNQWTLTRRVRKRRIQEDSNSVRIASRSFVAVAVASLVRQQWTLGWQFNHDRFHLTKAVFKWRDCEFVLLVLVFRGQQRTGGGRFFAA